MAAFAAEIPTFFPIVGVDVAEVEEEDDEDVAVELGLNRDCCVRESTGVAVLTDDPLGRSVAGGERQEEDAEAEDCIA